MGAAEAGGTIYPLNCCDPCGARHAGAVIPSEGENTSFPFPATMTIPLGIGLPVLDLLGLRGAALKASDPDSATFRKYLSLEQFTGVAPGSQGGGFAEVTMDIEMAIAMTPGLSQVVVFEGKNAFASIFMAIANRPDIHQITDSFWWGPTDANVKQVELEFAVQGQSFFVASGDFAVGGSGGRYVEEPHDVRADDFVVDVGGTVLQMSGSSYGSESGWQGSGGGPLPSVPIPYYQVGLTTRTSSQVSTTNRNLPDVALPSTGLFTWISGQRQSGGGTSAAAPLLAGFTAMMNEQSKANGLGQVGFANPLFYAIAKTSAYPTTFNDIQTGNNGYPAGPGYDLVTGLGSPKCGLIDKVAPAPVADGGTLPPPSLTVGVTGSMVGPDVCLSGVGMKPGATVRTSYAGIPGRECPVPC